MEDVVNEVEAIVKKLILSRIRNNIPGMQSMSKIITNVNSKLQPQSQRIRRGTITKNGDK
jgi:hypothetical protein